MKKNIIYLVPMFILVGACAPQGSGFEFARGELPKKIPCEEPQEMPDCTDAQYQKNRVLTITVNSESEKVVVAPKTICVLSPGEITVNVNFAGSPKKNSVRTVPKDFADLWVFGDNRNDAKKFALIVDESVDTGEYDYGVATTESGCIDPRISVKKT